MAEKLELIQSEIDRVEEAVDALHDVRNVDDIIGMLNERLIVLNFAKEQYEVLASLEYNAQMNELRREHERNLL